ncbi:hypothetical protein ILUMI_13546 [Ignelater luminosus]|uniref:Uncharacterized protein n=1 Tax=Ignelater luminosus TaxID=2038154 RepID=A0A8K0CS42_IGNLU|nr:hypothetical protein ILUMI_13546 [Ignelater luminosus]
MLKLLSFLSESGVSTYYHAIQLFSPVLLRIQSASDSDSESEISPFELVKLLNKGSNSPSRSVSSRRAIFTPITAAWSKHDQMPVHPSIAAISSGIGDFIKDMDKPEPSDLLRLFCTDDIFEYIILQTHL